MSESMTANLPATWTTTSLEHAAHIRDELRQPVNAQERTLRPGIYPYYGATGQVGWIDGYLAEGDFVLVGEDGAPFLEPTKPKAYMVRGRFWVNNHAHVLQAIDGLTTNRYLLHALNAADYRAYVNGTTRLKLTQGSMRQMPIHLAPLPEQHRIVEEIEKQFSRLDEAVANLKRVQANLKRYRASVLQAACEGRLVPTEAELARKEGREYEPADVLLQRILIERRRKWEENELAKMREKGKEPKDDKWKTRYKEPVAPDVSGLPELPEGWCWARAEQLCEFITKGTTPSAEKLFAGTGDIP